MDVEKILKESNEAYAPAVMWFTSGEVDEKEMTYQLEGFRAQGIRDFFIHPSTGTLGDYLGPYFFRMVRHARDEAKRLGMKYWIYDEYNWSSGVAAGQVLKKAPFAHGSCLLRIEQSVLSGENARIALPPKARFNTVFLLATKNGEPFSPVLDGDFVLYQNDSAAEEKIEIFVSKWDLGKIAALKNSPVVEKDEEGYLDLLDPEAVEVFISCTHEKYKAEIGEDFGKSVMGVFCDEPVSYFDFHEWGDESFKTLPWSRRFAARFKKMKGYDIVPRLGALFQGEDKKLLVDYWESVSAMMMEGFAGRTYEWCQKNGLVATGHIDGEESILSQVYRSGDMFEFYKHFDMPGIDSIMTYFRLNDYTFAITPKLVSSAAHFLHKERVLCETFTISGWEITLADMKRAINKLALLGVNFVQYMGARYDFLLAQNAQAMTNNFQNPLFKHYGALSAYTEGLQAFVSKTEYDAHLLVFYPMTTARTEIFGRTLLGEWDHPINMTVYGAVNSLLSLQIPFEIGFEQVIDGALVEGGRFVIDGRYYDTLILPETEYLKKPTYEKIRAFAEGGGKLIGLNCKPLKVIDDAITAVEIPSLVSVHCRAYEIEGENHPCWEHGQPFDGYQRAPMGDFTSALREVLGSGEGYPLSILPQDGILSAFRKDKEGYYALIVNDKAESATVEGELFATEDAALYDTVSAKERPINRSENRFSFVLAPYESAILSLGKKSTAAAEVFGEEEEVPVSAAAFRPLSENYAHPRMRNLRGEVADRVIRAHLAADPVAVCAAAMEANEENSVLCRGLGSDYMPVAGSRDYFGWTPVDRKSVKPKETVACIYDFSLDFLPSDLCIVCDRELEETYYLNGTRLFSSKTERVWHRRNAVFDISSLVRVGENRLVSVCTYPDYQRPFPLPAPALRGDFRFFSDCVLTSRAGEGGFGPWNKKGYLCYSGDGEYQVNFAYEGEGRLVLSVETKDTVEVLVNGQSIGKKFCAPYVFDITSLAKQGENTLILRVTSTLSNFIYKDTFSGINGIKLVKKK